MDATQVSESSSAACPECVEVLGAYRPERFPTVEEYRAAVCRYPEPVWASAEVAATVEGSDAGEDAYWSSFLSRA